MARTFIGTSKWHRLGMRNPEPVPTGVEASLRLRRITGARVTSLNDCRPRPLTVQPAHRKLAGYVVP